MKKVLITGSGGQDGSYLAELLMKKGCLVYCMYKSEEEHARLKRQLEEKGNLKLIKGDMLDRESVHNLIKQSRPNEIYNLASQSHVGLSFKQPEHTRDVNYFGVLRLLTAIKLFVPNAKLFQASTGELFGHFSGLPQDEAAPFNPISPYAKSKLEAHLEIQKARAGGLFACNGILFNHESPRRGENFVTKKITRSMARIKLGLQAHLEIGNLSSERDWGYAPDFVEAMWMMLQQDEPGDYVIGTGEKHSVREFVEAAAEPLGINISWKGDGISEEGYDQNGKRIIVVNPEFFREADKNTPCGNATKARKKLNWKPRVSFNELVSIMAKKDYEDLVNLRVGK